MGAAGVDDRSRRDATGSQAYINIEATGSGRSGAPLRDRAGQRLADRPVGAAAPHPRGASFGIEIYRRLPNDTDFSILKRARYSRAELRARRRQLRVPHRARHARSADADAALRETGENVVAIATALDRADITRRRRRGDLLRHRRRRSRQLLVVAVVDRRRRRWCAACWRGSASPPRRCASGASGAGC